MSGWAALDDLTVTLTARVEDPTGIHEHGTTALALGVASRNPFGAEVVLSLSLPGTAHAAIEIYDLRGRLVRTLLSGQLGAGTHPAVWDGRDGGGTRVASGIYFARASVGDWRGAQKLVLLR